jgi:hypothetical protein
LGTMKQAPGSTRMVLSSMTVGAPDFFLAGRREIGAESRVRYEQRLLAVAAQDTTVASSIRTLLKMASDARARR